MTAVIIFFYGIVRLVYSLIIFGSWGLHIVDIATTCIFMATGVVGYLKKNEFKSLNLSLVLSLLSVVFGIFVSVIEGGLLISNIGDLFLTLLAGIFFGCLCPVLHLGSVLVINSQNKALKKEKIQKENSLENSERTENIKPEKAPGPFAIFLRTADFVAKRELFSLAGFILGIFIVFAGYAFASAAGASESGRSFTSAAFLVVAIVVYFIFSCVGKSIYKNGQIGYCAYAIKNGECPKNKKQIATEFLDNRFSTRTVFPMVVIVLDYLLSRKSLKKDMQKKKTAGLILRRNITDFITFFVAGLVPVIGYCSISWLLTNPEDTLCKGIFDGLTGFVKRLKKILPTLMLTFFIQLIIVAGLIAAITLGGLALIDSGAVLSENYEQLSEALPLIFGVASVASAAFAIVIVKLFFWYFIQSWGMIRVMNKYLKELTNAGCESVWYKKLNEKYKAKLGVSTDL